MFGLLGCIQKSVLLPAQQNMVADLEKFQKDAAFMMRKTHLDKTSARACTKALSTLQHIPVAELELGEHHKDARVEGLVCCKAVKVSLYNFVPSRTNIRDIRRLLPEGTRLAIKEPYYKPFLDGSSGIRVDNPADVVFMTDTLQTPEDSQRVNFDELKALGNQAYRSALSCLQAHDSHTTWKSHKTQPGNGKCCC